LNYASWGYFFLVNIFFGSLSLYVKDFLILSFVANDSDLCKFLVYGG
jgi:hypothetical protein